MVINGELHGYFQGKRGLRQGDPISSLLFVLAMDVLSKMLDEGARTNRFKPHPSCEEPLITHLSFADDVLVFFDGSEESLRGILEILEEFKQLSGLRVNKEKTELLIDGGSHSLCSELAEAVGIKQGSLPVRYLGVPLSAKKMHKSDFKPLLDKIEVKFNSWTVKHLSFAGRFQLIQAVIYSTITFWTSIFILPNECIRILERMCSAFLWRGAPQSARSAKVSWEIVCTPREEGGLGLKRLEAWNKVLALKLIWLLFAAGGSLWVSWMKRHRIGSENFWELLPRRGDSWIWKKLCKLRPLARPFVVCEVGSGHTASFWFDNWTDLGPLIHLTGVRGPAISGMHKDATVAEALVNGNWWISASRSRNVFITLLKQCLTSSTPIVQSSSDDVYLWRVGQESPSNRFSTAKTWNALHPPNAPVFWHSQIWFKGGIQTTPVL
ncbi:Reverse transcriptase domain-containing protein [Hirschfeldia incana]|nr:Reverse transcriptase domain-containing protein [Hirschfeldia incana]